MRHLLVRAFCTAALLLVTGSAVAQIDCGDCDPFTSYCSDMCYRCLRPSQDGCADYDTEWTTCGQVMGENCLQDGCTPSWQETERVAVGTYGETFYGWYAGWPQFACEHHTVYRVTESDVNQCNYNPYWHSVQYCDDVTDYRSPWYSDHVPGCCTPYSCNDWHSCF